MTPRPQITLFDEIIVDSFAGGGGASTGIELATGRVVDIAINHDPDAILMHRTNHPHTRHIQASVWDVDPAEVCGGRPVGLLWASPDCKHFSKAKGGKPVEKTIRGLAWIVLRWAGTVHPRVIILENVEEFQTWGPVRKGKPMKKLAGKTFRRWLDQLRALGYAVEYRELVAADYGAPTTRKRFFLIARRDGRPIVWPEPTHAPADSPEVKAGRKKPWRSAAEIIDWSLPCPSVFDTREEIKAKYGLSAQRPLRPNTMRRVMRGLDKFVLQSERPFIVGVGGRCGDCPPRPVDQPHRTITAKADAALCVPTLIQYHSEQTESVRGQKADTPLCTVDAANRYGLVAPVLVKYYGTATGQAADGPLHTVTSKDREGLTVAYIAKLKGQNTGQAADRPLHTVTAGGTHFGVVTVKAAPGADLRHWPKIRELLNTCCGYHLAEDDVLLLDLGGVRYYISDIGLRMLTPRELYAANGFPPDYIIDRDYTGREYGKSKQVARCGNAVPPPFAAALVRANLPEWCGETLTTMREVEKAVAV